MTYPIIDLLKVKSSLDWIHNSHVYAENESPFHKQLTTQIVQQYIDPLNLPLDSKIIDLGCGPGYFLNEMASRGYTDVTGITLSEDDRNICHANGHKTIPIDMSFLPTQEGYHDESVDFIFARHSFEHSPFPIITLAEWNRVLKNNSLIYIEVPQPNCERKFEWNMNHYSIFGSEQLAALLVRTGFYIEKFNNLEFDLVTSIDEDGNKKTVKEKYYCVVARKKMCIDI
jgi:SAM-dependent methyltransferase